MKWIENCNIIIHKNLIHNQKYMVRLEGGNEIKAKFYVYQGGEEVAFVSPTTHEELSVTHFFA